MRIIVAALFSLHFLGIFSSTLVNAQVLTVKDHVSNPSVWQNPSNYFMSTVNSNGPLKAVAGLSFNGNGKQLKTVGGIFWFNLSGQIGGAVPNPGTFKIRFSFYQDAQDFALDPFRENPPSSNWYHEYSIPSNPNYLTPVGIIGSSALYYIEVDVSALHINTTNGQMHLTSLVIEDVLPEYPIQGFIIRSRGSAGSIGTTGDWGARIFPGQPNYAGPLQIVTNGFVNWLAAKITTNKFGLQASAPSCRPGNC